MIVPSRKSRPAAEERDHREGDDAGEEELDLDRSEGRDRELPEPLQRATAQQAPSHHRNSSRPATIRPYGSNRFSFPPALSGSRREKGEYYGVA